MNKKDKTIGVTVEETKQGQEVKIGDKVIGMISSENERFIASVSAGETFKVKDQEEGLEVILQQYHLHQG